MRGWIDESNDTHDVIVHAVDKADLDLIADECRRLHNNGQTKTGDGDWHIGKYDGWTILQWCNTHGATWKQFWRDPAVRERFFADPDNAAFRIHKGRL